MCVYIYFIHSLLFVCFFFLFYVFPVIDWPQNWIKRYGRRNGFLFYCLRYFLLLNWQRNIWISEDEFLALFSLVFATKNEIEYQEVAIPPSARCITIYNWFQVIHLHLILFFKILFCSLKMHWPKHLRKASNLMAFKSLTLKSHSVSVVSRAKVELPFFFFYLYSYDTPCHFHSWMKWMEKAFFSKELIIWENRLLYECFLEHTNVQYLIY